MLSVLPVRSWHWTSGCRPPLSTRRLPRSNKNPKEAKMPGLVRGMARTAAVVGTATATRNAVNRRQANKNAEAYAHAANTAAAEMTPPPQQYAPPPQVVYAEAPAAPV